MKAGLMECIGCETQFVGTGEHCNKCSALIEAADAINEQQRIPEVVSSYDTGRHEERHAVTTFIRGLTSGAKELSLTKDNGLDDHTLEWLATILENGLHAE